MRRALADDRGSATIVNAGILVALVSLFAVIATAGALVVARHQAQTAADLAAVAGAYALFRGLEPCAAAAEVAALNGASLGACRAEGRDVVAAASVRGREAWARAGPL